MYVRQPMSNIQNSKSLTKEEESWVTTDPVVAIHPLYLPHLQLQSCLVHSMLLMPGRSGYRIPVGGEILRTRPDRPLGIMSAGLLPVGKEAGPWVVFTIHLVQRRG